MNKKLLTFFILSSLFFTQVFALTSEEKWAILSNFKQESQDLIFESDFSLWDFSATDLFKSTNKINIFENIQDKAQLKREEIESKRQNILNDIFSLEKSIDSIEEDITDLVRETNKINAEIVDTSKKIKSNENQIELLTSKIEKSKEVLLDYTVYLYKKWNLILSDWEIDNFKAVILNSENLDEVINDIYFKEIISVAWKKLIDKHRKYIFSLYVEQQDLEESSARLKKLRKDFLIKKKALDDKKEFKQRLLDESKWKDSLYKKYIESQMEIEKDLKLKAFKEKLKFNEISKEILWKYGCNFVDVSKNTPELRSMTQECIDLNKMLYWESKLTWFDDSTTNVLAWPVNPSKGISAYYLDEDYEKDYWIEHNSIDIITDQWTDIVAPADWYVLYIQEPNSPNYSYLALKHANWFVTVYWHLSNVLVQKYDFVKAWEVFAETGGEYWTNWAWYLTTWPHLHLEVFKDENYRDPLDFLDISVLNFDNLPEKYRFKFYADYKERTWKEYDKKIESWSTVFKLDWDTEIERQKSLLNKYARSDFANWDMWVEWALEWDIDPTFIMCIWLAESSLWRALKSSYNVWNIWNDDSWNTWQFDNPSQGIYWIWKTLNNKYFSHINNIWRLSWAWRKAIWWPECSIENPCYATDTNHWHNNIIKCMSFIKWRYVANDYKFRLGQ